jgi:hypothetical protein
MQMALAGASRLIPANPQLQNLNEWQRPNFCPLRQRKTLADDSLYRRAFIRRNPKYTLRDSNPDTRLAQRREGFATADRHDTSFCLKSAILPTLSCSASVLIPENWLLGDSLGCHLN